MKILQINKFYFLKGGSETYLFELEKELNNLGFNIHQFSMHHFKNKPSYFSDYFVNNIEYENASLIKSVDLAFKIIYSREARIKLSRLLDHFSIDLAHLHLFQHQISLSILPELNNRQIPIIYTAHDLKSICPNYKMLTHDGICERCKGGKYYNCFIHKCTKNSRLKSLVNVLEMYFSSMFNLYNLIDIIITPSNFYRKKLIEFRFPEKKVIHIPNFVNDNRILPCYDTGEYFLYFGRLSNEKGIITLLKAMRKIKLSKLVIAGTGPHKKHIEKIIIKYRLKNVILVGFKSGNELVSLIQGAMFTVLPSEWYENGSIALLESMAYGKPVIGSNIGGIPEHITNGDDGLIFETGNEYDLAEKINIMLQSNRKCLAMGKNARRKVETVYSKKKHIEAICNLYHKYHKKYNYKC